MRRAMIGLGLVMLAVCTTTMVDQAHADFDITNWSSTGALDLFNMVGDAEFNAGLNAVTLTDFRTGSLGAVWTRTPEKVTNGFEIAMNWMFTNVSEPDAGDGFAIVLQGASSDALGSGNGGLGYFGLTDSAYTAVEMDTSQVSTVGTLTDPNSNHAALVVSGVQEVVQAVDADINDIVLQGMIIKYDVSTPGEEFLSVTHRSQEVLRHRARIADIVDLIDDTHAILGITASTPDSTAQRLAIVTFSFVGSTGGPVGNEELLLFIVGGLGGAIILAFATMVITGGGGSHESRESRRRRKRKEKRRRKRRRASSSSSDSDKEVKQANLQIANPPGGAVLMMPPPAYSPLQSANGVGAPMVMAAPMGTPMGTAGVSALPPTPPPRSASNASLVRPPLARKPSDASLVASSGSGGPTNYVTRDGKGDAVAFQIPELDGMKPATALGPDAVNRALNKALPYSHPDDRSEASIMRYGHDAGSVAPDNRATTKFTPTPGGRVRGGGRTRARTNDAGGQGPVGGGGVKANRAPRQRGAYSGKPGPSALPGGNSQSVIVVGESDGARSVGGRPPSDHGAGGGAGGGGRRSVKATQEFGGTSPEDLTFPKGAIIIVERDEGEWSYGKYNDHHGWFPNYIVEDV